MLKFVQPVLVPGEEGGLDVGAEGTKYLYVFCEHNAGQNHVLTLWRRNFFFLF